MAILKRHLNRTPPIVLTLWLCVVFAVSGMMQFIPHAGHHHHHEVAEGLAHAQSHYDHDSGNLHGLDGSHPIEPCCVIANQVPSSSKPASFASVDSPNNSKTLEVYGLVANCLSGVPPPKLDALSAYANVCSLLGTATGPDRTIVLLI